MTNCTSNGGTADYRDVEPGDVGQDHIRRQPGKRYRKRDHDADHEADDRQRNRFGDRRLGQRHQAVKN